MEEIFTKGFGIRPRRVVKNFSPEDRAQQQYKDDSDINNILAKYRRTGVLNHVTKYGAMYGDIPALSFMEAQNLVIAARRMFDELPGEIRQRFNGRPEEFLAFVQNPANLDEMRRLGLALPAKPEVPSEPSEPAPAGDGTVTPT